MLKKIKLTNFKTHESTHIELETFMTIITGENNSGKTSLLESMLIFQECYHATIFEIQKKTIKKVKEGILTVGQYDFAGKNISSFNSVRSIDKKELFFKDSNTFNIELFFTTDESDLSICFEVSRGKVEGIYNIKPIITNENLILLNSFNPLNFLYIINTQPISTISSNEVYLSPKNLQFNIEHNNSRNIIRNRLLSISKNYELFSQLTSQIEYILGYKFVFDISFNLNEDMYIDVKFKAKDDKYFQDIALLGSGTLQIIEVLIGLNIDNGALEKIVLLDEPDSHMHRGLQKRLVSKLREISKSKIQIFLTTHNEQIISNSIFGEVIHLYHSNTTMAVKPISINYRQGRQTGVLENLSKTKVYETLGVSSSIMELLEAVESDRIVLVEGKSDAEFIKVLQQNKEKFIPLPNTKNVKFWSINGIDDLPNKLKYWKNILENIKSEKDIWSKSILVLDMDSLTFDECNILKSNIEKTYGIKVYFWKAYTVESLILNDFKCFSDTFSKLYGCNSDDLYQELNNLNNNIDIDEFSHRIKGQRKSRGNSYYNAFGEVDLNLFDGDKYANYLKFVEQNTNKLKLLYSKEEIKKLFDILFKKFDIDENIDENILTIKFFENNTGECLDSDINSLLGEIYN